MIKSKIVPGRLTTNNVILETHEYVTINTLLAAGYDVELIQKSHTPHTKSADIFMVGLIWEMKAPKGKSSHTMEHIFKKAAHQARNIVIDLQRTKITDEQATPSLERVFKTSRSVHNLWIITKKLEMLKRKK